MAQKGGITAKKIFFHLAIIVCTVLLIEIFVCNYKHFLLLPTEDKVFEVSELDIYGLTYEESTGLYRATVDNPTVEITDLGCEVRTIYAGVDWPDENRSILNIKIHYTDETRLNYVSYGKQMEIVKDFARSRYIQEDFFGKSEKIKLQLMIGKGEKVQFDLIVINPTVPFVFSLARVAAMLILSLGIYAFVMLFHYRRTIEKKDISFAVKTLSTLLFTLLMTVVMGDMFGGFANAPAQSGGTQISKELVDSFLSGQVSMLEKPTDEFLQIDDPYVPANRDGTHYLWDHVYYDGEYYSYYGVTPVFMIFMPFKLLTGKYLYDGYAVYLFSLVSVLFLSLAYYGLINKFCRNTPLFLQVFGQIILLMSCGILSNIVRPAFYEVATSCALMCFSIALFHIASSNLLADSQKISYYHLFFASFWIALAVLARATYALYAVCFVISALVGYISRRKTLDMREKLKFAAYAVLPLALFGIMQCAYNFIRFGNILEFGIRYSLTINDFTKTRFRPAFAFTSIYNFLFAVPNITDSAYFIKPSTLDFGASGYYFFETHSAIGLFTRVPLLYGLFLLPFKGKAKPWAEKLKFALRCYLPCVIVPIIIVAVTWESGFAIRYYSDFAPLMLILTLILFYRSYLENPNREKTYAVIFGAVALMSFVGAMAVMYDYVPNFGRHIGYCDLGYTYKYYRVARELAFWL